MPVLRIQNYARDSWVNSGLCACLIIIVTRPAEAGKEDWELGQAP